MKLPIPTNSGIPYIGNLDAEGNLAIPTEQYIKSGGIYVPVSASNPLPITAVFGLVNEPFTGSTTVTHTFTKPMREFFISNDGDSDLTITINGMTFTVYPFTSFDEAFEPFTFVTITTEGPYQAWGRA